MNDRRTHAPGRRPALQQTARTLRLAVEVIRRADREHPADAVLREVLKGARDSSPAEAREVSGAVFAYYRWFGWLRSEKGLDRRVVRALELAEQFRKNPFSLPADVLRVPYAPPTSNTAA